MLIAQLPPDSQTAIASQFTLSALATATPKAIGALTMAQASAVIPSVLRRFVKIFSFRRARTFAPPLDWLGPAQTQGLSNLDIYFSGTITGQN